MFFFINIIFKNVSNLRNKYFMLKNTSIRNIYTYYTSLILYRYIVKVKNKWVEINKNTFIKIYE